MTTPRQSTQTTSHVVIVMHDFTRWWNTVPIFGWINDVVDAVNLIVNIIGDKRVCRAAVQCHSANADTSFGVVTVRLSARVLRRDACDLSYVEQLRTLRFRAISVRDCLRSHDGVRTVAEAGRVP